MRVVSPTIQSAIYQNISQWISENTAAQLKDIGTLPGGKEAFYDWVADNDLQNALQNLQNLHGVMDMGGGSFEIAYPTTAADNYAVPFDINDQRIYVHAQSYLGLGQDYSRYQYTDDNACFPINYPMPDATTASGDATQCEASLIPLLAAGW